MHNDITELRDDFEQLRRKYDSLRESFGKLIRACQSGDFTDVQFFAADARADDGGGDREHHPRDVNRECVGRTSSAEEAVDAASGDEGTQTVAE